MEKEKFAEIVDKGECMSTLYQYPTFPWPEPFLKNVACKEEWAKYGFYPSNGLVGEVAYNLESQVYILKINDTFYVPMTRKGIQFISEIDYNRKKSSHSIKGMDNRQLKINDDWDKLTKQTYTIMNTISNIGEVNLTMLKDFGLHSYNQQWIAQNIPSPINGNRYNHLRADAPFYCNSSMGVMLNHYKEKEGFKNMINQLVTQFSQDYTVINKNLSQIADWVVTQTTISIRQEGSDKLDLQNVGWWMGIASYVACIINTSYKAQYEKIFIAAWSKYFTNETLF